MREVQGRLGNQHQAGHVIRAVLNAEGLALSAQVVKGTGLRDDLTMARMHKAAAVMQFKLEGQMIARHPEWKMDHRRLLHRMNLKAGTIDIDGQSYKPGMAWPRSLGLPVASTILPRR